MVSFASRSLLPQSFYIISWIAVGLRFLPTSKQAAATTKRTTACLARLSDERAAVVVQQQFSKSEPLNPFQCRLPDKPLAFIFQAADEHCALRQQDIELVHQVQNRQLVPTYVGALHNSRMSNDTDATPRLEIPVHGAYRGFPRFLLAHTVSRSRRVSSGE